MRKNLSKPPSVVAWSWAGKELKNCALTLIVLGIGGHLMAADATPAAARDKTSDLNNIAILKPAKPGETALAPLPDLEAELAGLWDWKELGSQPLDVEVVETIVKDGYIIEGIYFNGYKGTSGQDRVFAYCSRPEKVEPKVPAYIELTGGSAGKLENILPLAKSSKCMVMCIEWRSARGQLKFQSKWANGNLGSTHDLTTLKNNACFRMGCATRRAIDYLQSLPYVDSGKIGVGGGSMGGFFTLLFSGIDHRISFGYNALGAGHLADSDSRLGTFDFPPGYKEIWLKAFDPHNYVGATKAKLLFQLAANDYYFWLGDGIADYQAVQGEKRLCIAPNSVHDVVPFGWKSPSAGRWIEYCTRQDKSYPSIAEVKNSGASYLLVPSADTKVAEATLYWSIGGKEVPWTARYWMAVPAKQTQEGWKAEVPARYAGLERMSFMNLTDDKKRTVSSVPAPFQGANAGKVPKLLWDGEALWDISIGISAWHPVGTNPKWPVGVSSTAQPAEGNGVIFAPAPKSRKDQFSVASTSFVLAGYQAREHKGLRIQVDGNGLPGELRIMLVRNYGAVKAQTRFPFLLKFSEKNQEFQIPWEQFTHEDSKTSVLSGNDPLLFETIWIDGARPEQKAVTVRVTGFLD